MDKKYITFVLSHITHGWIWDYFKCKYSTKEYVKFILPRITDKRISGYFKYKWQLTKNRSRLFYHTSQIGEFETILNANTALKNTLNSFYHASKISDFQATLNASDN